MRRLGEFAERLGRPERYVVAYSGGLDSTVLLHSVAHSPDVPVKAVHVDHQLQPESGDWARHCRRTASALAVGFQLLTVEPDLDAGKGLEGAAREARYRALEAVLKPGDWLLSAHHLDDQAETLLLNLLRGSGPDGLAAMPGSRRIGKNWLLRPFLDVPRSALERYASEHSLRWIEDPSNRSAEQDRNFLRHEVMPVIRERWPDASTRFEHSARLAAEASSLLRELAEADLELLGGARRIALAGFRDLSGPRQRNVLRAAVRDLGLPAPPATAIRALQEDLIGARADAEPVVAWPGVEARRSGDALYLMPPLPPAPKRNISIEAETTVLPAGLGRIRLRANDDEDAGRAVVAGGLNVRWREGGEKIRVRGRNRSLKKLLQEARVLPWMRDRIPLIYADDRLIAVADLFLADEADATGLSVRWEAAPELR